MSFYSLLPLKEKIEADQPFLRFELVSLWSAVPESERTPEALAEFLTEASKEITLHPRYARVLQMAESAMLDAGKLKFSPTRYFLPSDMPTTAQLKKAWETLFIDLAKLNDCRDNLSHYLKVIRQEYSKMQAIVSALKQFTLDTATCAGFKGVADRERHFQLYAVDTLYMQRNFANAVDDLSVHLESVVSRIYAMARVDSSLGALSRKTSEDNFIEGRGSQARTSAPEEHVVQAEPPQAIPAPSLPGVVESITETSL